MKNLIIFSPEYWWEASKGEVLNGRVENIEKWGGMARVVKETAERLPDLGWDVTVLARKKGLNGPIYPFSYYSTNNIVHYHPTDGVDVYGIPPCSGMGENVQKRSASLYAGQPLDCIASWDHIFTAINYARDFNRDLDKKFRHTDDTIVHGHDFYGAQFIYNVKTARTMPDLKTVLTVHMSSERTEDEVRRDERLQWEAKGCKLADLVHVISRYQEKLIKTNYKIRRSKIVYIPNGVDTEKFRPIDQEEKTTAGNGQIILKKHGLFGKKYILFLGRIDRVKGISQLIEAFGLIASKHPDYHLAVFGIPADMGYYNEILSLQRGLETGIRERVNIHTTSLPEQELISIIKSASFATFPSLVEAFGLVALEAQACGLPVVAGRVGGLQECVEDGKTGVLVDSRDPGSIAAGLEEVMANRETLAANARPFALNYGWDKIAERYDKELYSRLDCI